MTHNYVGKSCKDNVEWKMQNTTEHMVWLHLYKVQEHVKLNNMLFRNAYTGGTARKKT